MRIVTLMPTATEVVACLGATSQIVGVSTSCDHPAEVMDRPRLTSPTLPDNIGTRSIDSRVVQAMVAGSPLIVVDTKRLAELQPDLIVAQAGCTVCAITPTQIGMLQALTNVSFVLLEGHDFAGVLDDIRRVGEAIDRGAAGEALVAHLAERWDALSAPNPAGPKVLFAEWTDPLWIGGHWMPELIHHAGGRDVFGRPGGPSYRSSWADALALEPDVVVFAACGYDLVANRESARFIATGETRRYALDGSRLTSRGSPRLLDGLAGLKALITGDLTDIDRNLVIALPPAD